MKNKFQFNWFLVLLFGLLTMCVTQVWGETVTSTFTSNKWAVGTGEPAWTSSGASATGMDASGRGVQTTLTNIKSSGLTLTNTSISSLGTITSIKITCSSNGTGGSISSVKVGATQFKYSENNSYTITNSNGQTPTFTGSANSGNIVITFASTATSKSLYVKSIEVTYTPAGGPAATVSSVSVTPSAANLTVGYTQQLSAEVVGTNNPAQTVTWESSNISIATVNSDGLVTAVAKGTCTITAKSTVDATKSGTCAVTVSNIGEDCAGTFYQFSNMTNFQDWGTSYAQKSHNFTEATVTIASANHSTTTITDCPVTKGADVTLVAKDGRTISAITFYCKQWSAKTQTITLHYSTDGGTNYTSTGITSDNFTISSSSLPTGTNAVKMTFSSQDNQVGIYGACVTFVEPAACEVAPVIGSINLTSKTKDQMVVSAGAITAGNTSPCSITDYGFVYSTTNATPTVGGSGCTKAQVGTTYTSGTVDKTIGSLTAGQTYYVRAYATNGNSTAYSDNTLTVVLPLLSQSATSLAFGDVTTGSNKSLNTITVGGVGLNGNISLSITGTDASLFTITDPSSKSFTPASGTVSASAVTIKYAPTATGSHSATLNISSDNATGLTVALTGTGVAPSYTVTAVSNNESWGTVSVSGTTITANPKSGYRVVADDGGYTVTAGTASVSHSNHSQTLTVTPSSDCTVRVNFEAIPMTTINWVVGGLAYSAGSPTTRIATGSQYSALTLPTAPADNTIGDCADHFMGWSTSNLGSQKGQSRPADLFKTAAGNATVISGSEITFYAVFATGGGDIVFNNAFANRADGVNTVIDLAANGPYVQGDITFTFAKTGSETEPRQTVAGGGQPECIRLFGGNKMTVSVASGNITNIVLTKADGTNAVSANVGTLSGETWTGSASSVTFTIGGASGHNKYTAATVTTTSGGAAQDYVTVCGRKLYVQLPGDWTAASAKYAIYYWGGASSGWSEWMTTEYSCGEQVRSAEIPEDATNVVFARFNSDTDVPGAYGKEWNRTGDLTLVNGKDYYQSLSKGGDNKYYGSWSNYTEKKTVRFDKQGHGADKEDQCVPIGGTASNPGDLANEMEWTFGGWYENAACTGSAFNFSTTITDDKTLYAKWTPAGTRTIYLNNGGSTYWGQLGNEVFFAHAYLGGSYEDVKMTAVDCDPQVFMAEIPANAANVIFVRDKNGTGIIAWEGANFFNKTGDLSLLAEKDLFTISSWSDGAWSVYSAPTYSISYAAGSNGTGSMTSTTGLACGANQAIPASTFTANTGYVFDGWVANVDVTINSANVTAGTKIEAGATIQNISNNIALTAQWKEIIYTLDHITVKTNPTKTEYEVGDNLDASGLEITLHYTDNIGGTGKTEDVTSGWTLSPADGSTLAAAANPKAITVTYGGKNTSFDITVTKYWTIEFYNAGVKVDAYTRRVADGQAIGALPVKGSMVSCDDTSTTFVGWMADTIDDKQDTPPSFVEATTIVNDNMELNAVWAEEY